MDNTKEKKGLLISIEFLDLGDQEYLKLIETSFAEYLKDSFKFTQRVVLGSWYYFYAIKNNNKDNEYFKNLIDNWVSKNISKIKYSFHAELSSKAYIDALKLDKDNSIL